jgi:hypothetical protein
MTDHIDSAASSFGRYWRQPKCRVPEKRGVGKNTSFGGLHQRAKAEKMPSSEAKKMDGYLLQENDFLGNIKQSSQCDHSSFYRYSLWRTRSGEHLFDGVAGDLGEALDTVRAHFLFLSGKGGPATRE